MFATKLYFHVREAFCALLCEPVVLARMGGLVLDPVRIEQTLAGQAAENGIDRPFVDDQIGERFEMLDDREAVLRTRRDREQDGEVEAASPGSALTSACYAL